MRTFIFIGLSIAAPIALAAQNQVNPKFEIRGGYEFADFASSKSESFKKVPGSSLSIFAQLSSSSNSAATVVLGFELDYVKLRSYVNEQHFLYNVYAPNKNANVLYDAIFDERFTYEFLEVCLPLEIYPAYFKNNMAFALYLGPSIGLGSQNLEVNEKSRSFVDSLQVHNYDWENESNPYTYPGGSGFCAPISLNIGASFFYEFLVVDLRYKYVFNLGSANNNVFLQLGLAY